MSNYNTRPGGGNQSLTSIEGIQYQTQELSGLDVPDNGSNTISDDAVDYLTVDSFPSVPALRINVPEISSAEAKFRYNFFLPNERETIDTAGEVLDVSISRSDEIFFQQKNDRLARYVEFSFRPPRKFNRIRTLRDTTLVTQNLDKILIEGGTNSSDFTGFELIDTGAETHLYDILNGSFLITEPDNIKGSPKDAYDQLLEAQSDGSITGEEKKLISSALKGIQSKGYTLAASDISAEGAETADDLVSRQNFTLQINNLIFDQIVDSTLRIPDSLFHDEFTFIKSKTPEISARARRSNSSNSRSESLYTTSVEAVSVTPVLASSAGRGDGSRFENLTKERASGTEFGSFPQILHAGYIIKKLEVLGDNTFADRGVIATDNPDGLFIIDKNVRYGGVYLYVIRSVYLVKMIAELRDRSDSSLDELAQVDVLVASEGRSVSINCIERVPPPPPTNINIRFDYKTRKPFITWQFPVNPQRDIKRFQIFKRHTTRHPFTLIAEYDFDNSTIRSPVTEIAQEQNLLSFKSPRITFTDNTWQSGEKPIYAIACVDAHGLSSNFSTQMQFEYIKRLNKIKNTVISMPNAPKPYPNILLNKDTFEDAIKVSGYSRMKVFLDPEHYKVTRTLKGTENKEQDLNFLRIDRQRDNYKIHILNLDLQKDKILNIRVGDFSGPPLSAIGRTQFSFESIDI